MPTDAELRALVNAMRSAARTPSAGPEVLNNFAFVLESLLRPQEPEQAAWERLGQLLQAFDDEIEARAADLARGKGGQHVPFHGDFASVPPSALNRLKWWSRELRAALNERNRK